MNRDLIKLYFEQSLKAYVTLNRTEEECLHSKMDDIWFNQFNDTDRRAVRYLQMDHKYRLVDGTTKARLQSINDYLGTRTLHANVFESKEEYLNLLTHWRGLHATGEHKTDLVNSYTYLMYMAARGLDLTKAFDKAGRYTSRNHISFITYLLKDERVRNEWFAIFGDSIHEKYRMIILNRMKTILTEM